MIDYLAIYGKAFALVTLTVLNVKVVTRDKRAAAFLTGGTLSAVWWFAAHSAANSHLPLAWLTYAFGAACGTVTGMYIGSMGKGKA